MKCPHGLEVGVQPGIQNEDIESWGDDPSPVLEFYSACDCCELLMHHSTCGVSYQVLRDGRTLCDVCYKGEPL